MILLRLEVQRLVRTRRGLPLAFVFVVTGLGGPVLARYLPDLVKQQTSENMTIIVSAARPADGISMFTSNALQLGLLVAVVVAAGILALDARPGLAIFYRTRVRPVDRVVLARAAVTTGAVTVGYLAGAACAFATTEVLIGHLDLGRFAVGVVLTEVYLCFAMATVVAATAVARSVAGAAGVAIGALLALPLIGLVPHVETWLPSKLARSQVAMAGAVAARDFVPAAATTIAAAAAMVGAALVTLRRREL